jgi:ATP adenylyltransferase
MDTLHAPWRIDYILAPKEPLREGGESLFTRMARSSDDVANLIIARGKSCFAVMNRYPYNGGHVMTVPYKQVANFNGLTPEEITELMLLTRCCQNAIQSAMNPDGFNVGINLGKVAGAGIVEHLHVHIVPRWNGDTNFMPVLGNTSVLPEALEETAAKLRSELARQKE